MAVEYAISELKKTKGKAKFYIAEEGTKLAPLLRCHVQDLVEDLAQLEKQRSAFKEREQEALDLISEAKELKRDMEKQAFLLEEAAKLRKESIAALAPQPASATAETSKSSCSQKLPRIKLPTFDGEATEDYRGFMEAFNDALSSDPNLGEVKKWLLLKAQLTGRALTLVKQLPTSPETYKIAVQMLEDAYGSVKRAVVKLYERIHHLPPAEMTTESLQSTHNQLEGYLLHLEKLKKETDKDDYLRAVILSKYPSELAHTLRVTDAMALKDFRKAVGDYIKIRDCTIQPMMIPPAKIVSSSNGTKGGAGGSKEKPRHDKGALNTGGGTLQGNVPPKQVTVTNKNVFKNKLRERKRSCIFCTGEHWHDECDRYKTLDERLKLVPDVCHRCLRPKHASDDECRFTKTCYYCKEATHNSALCPKQFTKVLLTTADSAAYGDATRFMTAVLPVGNLARTKGADARAVLDSCGGRSLITEDLAAELGLTASGGKKARFEGANRVPLYDKPSSSYKLLLFPPGARAVEIEVFVVPEIVENVVATDVVAFKDAYPRYAELPMPAEGNGRRVQLLLGYRGLTSILTLQNSILVEPHLQLLSTKFGWVPLGWLPGEAADCLDSSVVGLLKEVDPVKLMSDLELVGLADFLQTNDEEETLVLEKFNATIQQIGKRYEIEWPYYKSDPDLEDNFGLAFGRLMSLYRQLVKDITLLRAYDGLIKDQAETDIIELVNLRASTRGRLVHYLPHRAVIRIGKSTPIRMVFDASARCSKTAHSLNNLIMKGGNWVTEIPAVLMRFRRYRVGMMSDITKAFLQISIAPKDRDVVRFLWLRDITKPPSKDNLCVYRFKRMAFGVVASPFLLTATIRHHLKNNPNEFGESIERDLYADNLIVSLPEAVSGEHFYHTMKEFFASMSMDLAQWVTDSAELRSRFSDADRVEGAIQSVLGLNWDTNARTMRLRDPHLPLAVKDRVTKRIALKEMATVYDPLGWMAPVVLKARLFVRKVWRLNYTWERPLTDELASEWDEIRGYLNRVATVALNRTYGFNGLDNAEQIEIHTFCDASAEAYGVVVYLRVLENGRWWTGLVAAKTRLSPNTKLTIPRLELLAAVTAGRYMHYVEEALQLKKEVTKYLWGDSRCVIAWYSSNKILPAFVEKAVKTIKSVGVREFRYVPSAENSADVVSRGATVDELLRMDWWHGPRWLSQQENWPVSNESCEQKVFMDQFEAIREEEVTNERLLLFRSLLQVKKEVDVSKNEGAPFELNPSDFSSVGALMRRTAYCLRTAGRFLRGRGSIPAREPLNYARARTLWFRWDQQRFYEPATRNKANVSYLKNLKVSEDEKGVMRCHTRLQWSRVPRNEIEPILLVKKSPLTRLLILSVHSANAHVGTSHTLAALRRQYWLPHGRREVFQTLKSFCHTCRRYEAQPFQAPEMAPLPAFRISRTETPFTNVGVDVFGPFKVRIGAERDAPVKKRWVILFTCLVVRAVHLEILEEMKAPDFLDSFRRFIGRRGVPKVVVCDNAPQFYVVEGIFQSVWHRFAEADVNERYYAQHEIEWRFIPAHSPWMGGAYERLIKEIKKAFERTYGGLALSERKFEIALIEIEGILNSRPITYVDRESETELISPNDFLQTRYPAVPIDFSRAPSGADLTASWRASEEYLEQFWKIWAEQYLREIRERRETMPNPRISEERAPMVGELVLMVDPTMRRSSWRAAVVERLINSEDGKVRSVQLRSANRVRMIRPVSKLAPLRLLMELSGEVGELTDGGRAIVVDQSGGEINVT